MVPKRLNMYMSDININQESIDRYVRQSQMRSMFDLHVKRATKSNDKGTFADAVNKVLNENLGNSEATNAVESMRNQTQGKTRDGKPQYGTQYLKTTEYGDYTKSFDTDKDDLKSLGLKDAKTDKEVEEVECQAQDDEWCDNEECPKCYEQAEDGEKNEYPSDDKDEELKRLLNKDKLNERFNSLYDNATTPINTPSPKAILEAIKSDYSGQPTTSTKMAKINEGVLGTIVGAGGNVLKAVGDVASLPGKVVSNVGDALTGHEDQEDDTSMTLDELIDVIKAMTPEEQEQLLKDLGVQDVTNEEQVNEAIGALVGGAARGVGAVARGAGAVLGGAAKLGAGVIGGLAAGVGAAAGGAAAGMLSGDKEDEEHKTKRKKKKGNLYTKEMAKVDKMNNDLSKDHEDEEYDDAQEADKWKKAREIVQIAKDQGIGEAPWEDHNDPEFEDGEMLDKLGKMPNVRATDNNGRITIDNNKGNIGKQADDVEDYEDGEEEPKKMSRYAKRIKRSIKQDAQSEDNEIKKTINSVVKNSKEATRKMEGGSKPRPKTKGSTLTPGRTYQKGDGARAQKELEDHKQYKSAQAGLHRTSRDESDKEWDKKNDKQHELMMAKAKSKAKTEDGEDDIKPPKYGKLVKDKKKKEALDKEKVKAKGIVKENSQWGVTPEPHVDLVQEKTMVEGYANAFTKYLK